MTKTLPVCIDSNAVEWTVSKAPKHVNTLLKILYDRDSGMDERVYYARVKPGGCIASHAHPNTEVFYVLSGTGVVTAGEERFEDIAGRVFFMRENVEHAIRNTGDEDVDLIAFAMHSEGAPQPQPVQSVVRSRRAHPGRAAKAAAPEKVAAPGPQKKSYLVHVQEVVKEMTGLEADTVTADAVLDDDLGFESLMVVDLGVILGTRVGINIDMDTAREWDSVGDILAHLEANVPKTEQ